MGSTSPSPDSSPAAFPPAVSPPSNASVTSPPPSFTQTEQTSDTPAPTSSLTPSNSTSPPPQSPPVPPVSTSPPPSTPKATPPPSSPPPLPPTSSPPPKPKNPLPATPPASPPPPLPATPPASTVTPTPPNSSPPPPLGTPPPPLGTPAPPALSPPPPLPVTPTPPPPAKIKSPPSADPPPAPLTEPPANSPPPPSSVPPSSNSPPAPTTPSESSPPPVPSLSLPPPGPPSNSSVNRSSPNSPLPTFPSEKPTARSANPGSDTTANSGSRDGGLSGGAVAIGIIVGFLALSLVVMAVWFTRRRKRRMSDSIGGYVMPSPFASSQNSDTSFLRPQQSIHRAGSASGSNFMYSPDQGGVGNSRQYFTYEELSEATYGFSNSNLLGEGGFGCVYKGCLPDGRVVAVKQLKIGGGQGEREFRAEVEIIGRVHHRHLVSLVGYCISEHQRLLVYDYVANNTLHYHLHDEGRQVMDWATRVKVAAGAAHGLAYLHEDCHPRIIHRDIKSSNILLDFNFDAQAKEYISKANSDMSC